MNAADIGPGQTIGRYRITARIATGGMAEVFLAHSEGAEGFRKAVVIKRLMPHLAKDAQVVELFLNEARIAGQLDHANIVHVFDLGSEGDAFYMVMEFLDGRALSEVRDMAKEHSEELSLAVGLKALADACAGLHYAHEFVAEDGQPLGIVHRDFSPDNIVITYDGRVKVVDFGIAKALAAATQSEPGTLKGKYFYMSPEMVLGEPLDRRADIFAAGIILYELLTGERPFAGDNPSEVLSLIARCQPRTPTSVNPDAPPDIEALALRCLARRPEDRPQTASDVRAAIEAHLLATGSMPTQADLGAYVERLFPADSDPERLRIVELRRLESSWPWTHGSAPRRGSTYTRPRRRVALWGLVAAGLVAFGAAAAVWAPWRDLPTDKKKLAAQCRELTKNDPKAAVKACRKAARVAPDDWKAAMALGSALVAAGEFGDAEELGNEWTKKRPDLAPAHVLLGDAYAGKRQGAKAETAYNLAAQIAPRDLEPRVKVGELYLAMGDLPKAGQAFEKARQIAPKDAKLVVRLGQVKARLGDWPGAEALLSQATRAMPDELDIRAELGYALHRVEKDQKALAELTAVTRKNPNYARAYYYLGFVYYRLDRADKAIEAYRTAFAREPRFADAHAALGDLFVQIGRPADAAKEYREALKIEPKHEAALAGLRQAP